MSAKNQVSPHVLIFDSGVGGLSILSQIKERIPGCRYAYATDNQGFPYGNKTSDYVIDRVTRTIHACIKASSTPFDIIIIACNTASTVALPALRTQFNIAIIGVVPAIKPAVSASTNQYIGLLATPATIQRNYTHTLIKDHGNDCHIVAIGSTELVLLAERKLTGKPIKTEDIMRVLQPFKQASTMNPTPEKLDHLVLACTHFPLLRDEIQQVIGDNVQLIDSAEAIANRVLYIIQELSLNLENSLTDEQPAQLFITEENESIKELAPTLNTFSLTKTIILAI